MQYAERVQRLIGEGAFSVLAEARALEAQGHRVINFAIGDPDFDTPTHIVSAAIDALRKGYTHYAPSPGMPELRQAVADYMHRTRGLNVHPEEVIITPGAKPIIFYALLACIEPNDEVICPSPGFPVYESVIQFVGATPVPVLVREERDFRWSLDEIASAITPRTKMIILNSPHNPTGGMLTIDDLTAIAELARTHNLWVLADEIYSQLTYDEPHVSIATLPDMRERTIIVDGFSKTFAMTGWRLGFGVMNRELARYLELLVVNSVSCTASFTQQAGITALRGSWECVERMRDEFRKRRDTLVEGLNAIPGIRCVMPKGAFYVYANVTDACRKLQLRDAREFQERLLREVHVAVLDRTAFGERLPDETEEYVRFSYVVDIDSIHEGLQRIRNWLQR